MTRRVVSPKEVAHLWANRAQDDARNSTGSFYFVGQGIYSYGSHFCIAYFLSDDIILWNSSNHSNTTSGHKSDVRQALSNTQWAKVLMLNGMTADTVRRIERNRGCKVFDSNIETQVRADIETLAQSTLNMRSLDKISSVVEKIDRKNLDCERLAKWFKAKWKPTPTISQVDIADKEKRTAWAKSILKASAKAKVENAEIEARRMLKHLGKFKEDPSIYGLDNTLAVTETALLRVHALENIFSKTTPKFKRLEAEMAPIRIEVQAALLERDLTTAAFDVKSAYKDVQKTSLEDHVNNGFYFQNRGNRDKFCKGVVLLQTHNRDSKYDEVLTQASVVIKRLDEMQVRRTENVLIDRTEFINDIKESASDRLRQLEGIRDRLKAYKGENHDVLELREFYSETHLHLQKLLSEQAQHAIQLWLDGKPGGAVPYDHKTLVRVKGNRVETSKGATVSLDDAIKLCRVARRIINAGGKDWTTMGQVMPKVGPYTVSRIGADGSATIGCHEFTAEVGMAAISMLEGMQLKEPA